MATPHPQKMTRVHNNQKIKKKGPQFVTCANNQQRYRKTKTEKKKKKNKVSNIPINDIVKNPFERKNK